MQGRALRNDTSDDGPGPSGDDGREVMRAGDAEREGDADDRAEDADHPRPREVDTVDAFDERKAPDRFEPEAADAVEMAYPHSAPIMAGISAS